MGFIMANWQEECLESFDGESLQCRFYQVPQTVKAVMILLHGLAEDQSLFEGLAKHACQNGFAVVSYDLRGHGQSSGDRLGWRRFSDHLDDLDLLLARVRDRFVDRPAFFFGHDLGALIACNFVLTRSPHIAGLILASLPIRLSLTEADHRRLRLLRWLAPQRRFGRADFLSSYWQAQEPRQANDYPQRLRVVSLLELVGAQRLLARHADDLQCPLLVFHATADTCSPLNKVKILFDSSLSYDKCFEVVDAPSRNLSRDGFSPDQRQLILDWCDKRYDKVLDLEEQERSNEVF